MADNPFDRFDAPSARRGNPFDRFDGRPAGDATPAVAARPATATIHPGGYGALDDAGSNFTFGLGDKVAAVGAAAGSMTSDALHGRPIRDFGPSYADALASETAQRQQYEAAYPTMAKLLSALGLFSGGPAATGLKAVGAGAVAGTVAGALSAAGSSHGTTGDQASQIALGAGLGAGGGAVVAKVLPGSIHAVGNALSRVSARTGMTAAPVVASSTQGRAQAVIGRALAADGGADVAGQLIADAADRGVPLSLADTGDNARGLAAKVSRAPGPSRTIMRDAAISRQEGQGERVQGAITRDLGPTVGTATEAQRLEDSARATAGPLYDQAYAAGAVDHPTITKLVAHPDMQNALSAGADIHAGETFLANARGETPPEPLVPGFPGVRELDYAKRALDQRISGAYAGDSVDKVKLPFLKDLRSTLINSMDQAVPAYAAARAAYAGPMQSAEALRMGKAAINKSGDDIAAETSKLGSGELDQYRLGFRSALSDAVDAKVDGTDKMKALVGTPKKRVALAQLFGGEAGLDNLMATLADEGRTSATYGRINAGSSTSRDLADDGVDHGVTDLARAGQHLFSGHPIKAAIDVGRHVYDKVQGEAGERLRSQLAVNLSETDPAVLATALRTARAAAIAKAARDRASKPIAIGSAAFTGRGAGYVASLLGGNQ